MYTVSAQSVGTPWATLWLIARDRLHVYCLSTVCRHSMGYSVVSSKYLVYMYTVSAQSVGTPWATLWLVARDRLHVYCLSTVCRHSMGYSVVSSKGSFTCILSQHSLSALHGLLCG